MGKTIRCRHMMYEQQLSHLPYKDADDLYRAVESKLKPDKFAMITHGMDTGDKHIHLMMSYKNARSIKNVAGIIGDKEQYIEAWDNKSGNGYAYLVHRTKNARAKYQYDPSEVRANFDYVKELAEITKNVEKASAKKNGGKNTMEEYLNKIYNGEITKDEVEGQITGSEYAKYKKQMEDVDAKRLQKAAIAFRRNMVQEGIPARIYWLCGNTGTGKSSLAKELARQENRPYFISGSTKDMFQDYKGEHTIILDEFRPGTLPYADLLKITDPFAEKVFAPSRYHDKYLAADLIIITTPFLPNVYYEELCRVDNSLNKAVDDFGQLQRRITATFYLSKNLIYKAKDEDEQEYAYIDNVIRYATQIMDKNSYPNPFSKTARASSITVNTVDLLHDLMAFNEPDEKEDEEHE